MPRNSMGAAIVCSCIAIGQSNSKAELTVHVSQELRQEPRIENVYICARLLFLNMLKHPLFLIIDGMSQAYRAYFAIRGLASTQGLPTNAIYGFAIMLKRVLDKFPPDYIAVAFDSPERTVRHTQYDLYKATRKKMPSDLAQQMPYVRKFCEAMRIPVLEM